MNRIWMYRETRKTTPFTEVDIMTMGAMRGKNLAELNYHVYNRSGEKILIGNMARYRTMRISAVFDQSSVCFMKWIRNEIN